jgi:hypothetical protein
VTSTRTRGTQPRYLGAVNDDDGLRVRYGTTADLRIPWHAVATVTSRRRRVPTRHHVHVDRGDDGTVVAVAVLKQTKVDVVLRRATTVSLPDGDDEITGLRLYADDVRGFVAAAREHLAGRPAEGSAAGARARAAE